MKRISMILLALMIMSISCEETNLVPPDITPKEEPEEVVNPFSNIPILPERVVYEVNIRAFSTAGNLDGVTAKLDHIQSLGANVIWLMPIYPIGELKGINSPYSIKDFQAVNTEFGDLDDLINLVNEAHSRDMAVILDWVANHTSWDHSWIKTPSWYVQDNEGNIVEPPGTGWADVAELNYESMDMQAEMIASMKYWIEKAGIDGYRCDAVDYVPAEFWSKAIEQVDASTDKALIWLGEGGDSENFTAGFEFNYAWDFYGKMKNIYSNSNSASSIFITHEQEVGMLSQGQSKLRYITNHDVYAWDETLDEIFTNQGAVGAFAATAFMGGVPLIYSGQEVGRLSLISFFGKDPIDWNQNPEILKQYQEIMTVRNEVLEVLQGDLVSYGNKDVIAFSRKTIESEILILVNTRATTTTMTLPADLQTTNWKDLLSNEQRGLQSEISLDAYEYLLLQKE